MTRDPDDRFGRAIEMLCFVHAEVEQSYGWVTRHNDYQKGGRATHWSNVYSLRQVCAKLRDP